MNLNPTPIAWAETLDGLKQGLIDGAETWASAVAYANMSPVVSQVVNLEFFCGTEHTAMSSKVFDKLGGELQDAVMESAYLTQVHVQAANEAALVNTVGFSEPQLPNTIFAKHGTRVSMLSDAAKREAEEMCSPEFHPGRVGEVARAPQQVVGRSRHLQVHLRHRPRDPEGHAAGERRATALVERASPPRQTGRRGGRLPRP